VSGYSALARLPPELRRVAEVAQVHYRGEGGGPGSEEEGEGDEGSERGAPRGQSPHWHPLVLQTGETAEQTEAGAVGMARPSPLTPHANQTPLC
jgi:hypothetical protein